MKISKLLPLSVMLTAALTLTACSDSNNTDEGLLTDPFDNTESTSAITADSQDPDITSDNPVRDHMELLSQGGYRCEVIEDRLQYNGDTVKFTVSMEASENCKANISIGISCYINGVPQKLSCGDKKDQTVLIEKDFEPGDDLKLNVEFDPVVSEEDADKEQLPITFVTYYNPDYTPTETYTAFGFLRDGRTITKKIIFKEKPDTVSIQTEDNYTELLRTQENIKKFDGLTMGDGRGKEALQGGKFAGSILKPDENGVIDLTLVLDNYEGGEYLFSLMKNNEIIKFNDGKDLIKVNIKSEHIYAVDIKLEGVEPGDVIQIIEQSPNGENPFSSNASTPFYIVKGSFAFATQDVGNNTPPVTPTDHSSGLTFGYVMLGYIEGEQRLAVMHSGDTEDGRILIYDIDKGQITASLNMSDYGDTGFFSDLGEEQPVEYTVCDWSNLQVLDEGIAVAKYKLTDHGEFSADEEFLLFDKYLKPVGEIKGNYVFSGIITAEVKNILNCETSIDGDEHYHDVYYLYNTDGSGKRKLFELAENERAVNLKTDATHLYGSIIDGSGMGAAFAVDLQSGEMIRNSNKYDIYGLGKIYSAGEYVLFATGKADPYTTAGGSLVIFDKGKGAFREINVTSVNETEHATITPDGKRIVTADSYRGSITDEEGGMLRVYDTKSGELIGSEKITMGSKPICGNEKIIICDSQSVREITYAEMGLN